MTLFEIQHTHDVDPPRSNPRNASTSEWTEELAEAVERLWPTHTAQRISEVLAERGYSFSRSSVISKANRLGLIKPEVERVKREPVVCQPVPEIECRHISFAEIEDGDCRFPFGDDPATMTFCGLPQCTTVVDGKEIRFSYCAHHRSITSRPGEPRGKPSALSLGQHRSGVFGRK